MHATRPSLPRLALAAVGIAAGLVLTVAVVTGRSGGPGADAAAVDVDVLGDPAPTAEGRWAPWATDDAGRPLRWDPCTPIEVVLRPEGAPEGAEEDLVLALRRLAVATGLELRFEGTTDETPSAGRPLAVRTGVGWRWAPVLVAWEAPGTGGLPLEPHDRGVAVPIAVRDGERWAFVTGQVVLNARRTDLRSGFGDRADSWGSTLMHELGHLLGLDHSADPSQLMAEEPGRGPVELGPGDLAGLRAIGASGGCVAAPDPARARDIAG